MADDNSSPLPIRKHIGNSLTAIAIKIIGRFIQQNKIGLLKQQCCKCCSRLLPATQLGEPGLWRKRKPERQQSFIETLRQQPIRLFEINVSARTRFDPLKHFKGITRVEQIGECLLSVTTDILRKHTNPAAARDGSTGW